MPTLRPSPGEGLIISNDTFEAMPPPAPVVVKVHVRRDPRTYYGIAIEASHPPAPNPQCLVPFFTDPTHREMVRTNTACCTIRNTLDYAAANAGIPLGAWQEAIAAEIASRLTTTSADPTEATMATIPPVAEDAYLAMGPALYKLQPIEVSMTTKALQAARKRALTIAQRKADAIIADANRSVAGIIAEANKRLADANTKLAGANAIVAPPAWTNGICPTFYYTEHSRWAIGLNFHFAISRFEIITSAVAGQRYRNAAGQDVAITTPYVRKMWPSNPGVAPFSVKVWTLIGSDGSYSPNQTFLDSVIAGTLPHLRHSGACNSPATHPPKLANRDHIARWAAALQLTHSKVDLSSLLNNYDSWDSRVKAFVPPALAEMMRHGDMVGLVSAAVAPLNEPWSPDGDSRSTFTAAARVNAEL